MNCADCGKAIEPGTHRNVAFDRPVRISVQTHGGRCNDNVRAWNRDQLMEYVDGQPKPQRRAQGVRA